MSSPAPLPWRHDTRAPRCLPIAPTTSYGGPGRAGGLPRRPQRLRERLRARGRASGTDRLLTARPGPPRAPSRPRCALRSNVRKGAQDVPVDTLLEVGAEGGDLLGVEVTTAAGEVPGRRADGSWRATERLEPGTAYVVRARVRGAEGPVVRERRFRTADLSLSPADLRLGGPAGRRDRRGRDAGRRAVRPAGHRPGRDGARDAGRGHAAPGRLLALAQRHRGALPAEGVLAGRQRGRGRPRRQRRRRRGRDLRAGEPPGRLHGGGGPRLPCRRPAPHHGGLLRRSAAAHHPDHHRQGRLHHPLRHQGRDGEVRVEADGLRDRRHRRATRPTTSTTCSGRCG